MGLSDSLQSRIKLIFVQEIARCNEFLGVGDLETVRSREGLCEGKRDNGSKVRLNSWRFS
jgi:hypothetical protein